MTHETREPSSTMSPSPASVKPCMAMVRKGGGRSVGEEAEREWEVRV